MYVRRNPEAIFDRDIKQRGAEADLDCWSHTERTDAIPPGFVGIPGSADYCGSGSVVADIAQRSLTNSRDSAGLAFGVVWCQCSLVVRPRLLRPRQGHVRALGPSEEARDRWTLPLCAQPDLRGRRRICCWLELDRRLVAHCRVCIRARRWVSPARHLL